jgi:spore coat polysaccharide biosynthesis protein SpsF
MSQTIAFIQARTTSSRLPGKVLQEIAGEPMLVNVYERLSRSVLVNRVVIATTTDPSDEPIVELCRDRGYAYFQGNLHDVLDRFYQAALTFEAQVIVRVTADCPLIDPALVDQTIKAFLGSEHDFPHRVSQRLINLSGQPYPYDFAANRLPPPWPRTFPVGLDTEVCSFIALQKAWKEARKKYQREHVMPYLYDDVGVSFDQPCRFRVLLLDHVPDYGSLRWTVDTPPDLEVVRRIYKHFNGRNDFTWKEALDLFEHEPELARINASVVHKNLYEFDHRANDWEK